jgi:hypothetical protein
MYVCGQLHVWGREFQGVCAEGGFLRIRSEYSHLVLALYLSLGLACRLDRRARANYF